MTIDDLLSESKRAIQPEIGRIAVSSSPREAIGHSISVDDVRVKWARKLTSKASRAALFGALFAEPSYDRQLSTHRDLTT